MIRKAKRHDDGDPDASRLDAMQGAGEEQTEPYMEYGEGAPEQATQQRAKSIVGVAGFAGQQDNAARGISVHSGFPNAGADTSLTSLDITKLLVRRPASTFFMRVDGENASEQGIFNGDIVVIDRALYPNDSDQVVWWDGEGFAISRSGRLPEGAEWWGVVTFAIHEYRRGR